MGMSVIHSFEANAADDPLQLAERFKDNDVVVFGWKHVPENTVIPKVLQNAASRLDPNSVSILLEQSGPKVSDWTDSFVWPDYVDFLQWAQKGGFILVNADMSWSERKEAMRAVQVPGDSNSNDWLLQFIREMGKVRSQFMAEKVPSALRQRPKALMIVGANHCTEIVDLLHSVGVKAISMITEFNDDTLVASYNGAVLGVGKKTGFFRTTARALGRGFTKIPSACSELLKSFSSK